MSSQRHDEASNLLPMPVQQPPSKLSTHAAEGIETKSRASSDNPSHTDRYKQEKQPTGVYWVTPFAAALLFLLGLSAAIGHYVFFSQIQDTAVENQTWTNRYSLALAFIFKSALTGAISIAMAQYVWSALRKKQQGTSIQTIDAMFSSGGSITSFLSLALWRSAVGTALLATCIWLMPLTALVAPTSLTVGLMAVSEPGESCIVPTLNWGPYANEFASGEFLNARDYEDNLLAPSIASERLTATVADTSRQNSWQSPCGSNCTYEVSFVAPSWQCAQHSLEEYSRVSDVYSYVDASFDTPITPLLYDEVFGQGPIYNATLNATTNQFWVAYSAGMVAEALGDSEPVDVTLGEALDVRAWSCQIANTTYDIRVDYTDGVQTNTLLKAEPFDTFVIPEVVWQGFEASDVSLALQDVAAMYLPVISILSGQIGTAPQQVIGYGTNMGLIAALTVEPPANASSAIYYLPQPDLGPLLQELSYNLSISLMSYPKLLVTSTTSVPCTKNLTKTVWKFEKWPLVAAYSAGLAVTLVCMAIGGFALVSNGVSHDTSFSSVMRTTTNHELTRLVETSGGNGASPLASRIGKQKLRFLDGSRRDHADDRLSDAGDGFVLVK